MKTKKKAKVSKLDELYSQFIQTEQTKVNPVESKIKIESRNPKDVIPGCWIRKSQSSPGWGVRSYAAKVVRVEENHIILEEAFEPFLSTPSKHLFLSDFIRNSSYHVVDEEEGKKIANAHIALVRGNQHLVAQDVGKHLGVGGGTGSTGRTVNQLQQGYESDNFQGNEDGFLSPGYGD